MTKAIGRPTILNKNIIDRLCEFISQGNWASTACNAVGIGESTFYSWKDKGERDIQNNKESVYKDFVEAIKKADAEAEAKVVSRFYEEATNPGSFVAPATYLERRYPERWGRRDRTIIDLHEEKTINIREVVVNMPQVIDGEAKEVPLLEAEST